MKYKKVIAIFRIEQLEKVEKKLHQLRIYGVSVSKVKGYSEYANLYAKDWMTLHARIELFTDESGAEVAAQAIMDAASLGMEGDGIVAILPADKLYLIRTKADADA